jgi:hypothetical protein
MNPSDPNHKAIPPMQPSTARFPLLFVLCSAPLLFGAEDCWRKVDNTPSCVPGEPSDEECYCRNGDPGQQICLDDALGFGECVCSNDGGAESDASQDAGGS